MRSLITCSLLLAWMIPARVFAQGAPLGPGRPGQKKLPPASQPATPPGTTPAPTTPAPASAPPSTPAPTAEPRRVTPPTTTVPATPAPSGGVASPPSGLGRPGSAAPSAPAPSPAIAGAAAPAASTTLPAEEAGPSDPTRDAPRSKRRVSARAGARAARVVGPAYGGGADLFLVRDQLRLAGRADILVTQGLGGREEIGTLGVVLGAARPGRVSPYAEVSLGGGLWHQGLFAQEVFVPVAAGGAEGGLEIALGPRGYVFGAVGVSGIARRVERFDGGQDTDQLWSASFRGGLGF